MCKCPASWHLDSGPCISDIRKENERLRAALTLIKERSSEGKICILADVGLGGVYQQSMTEK